MTFSAFGLNPELMRGLRDLSYTRPTPIQKEAIAPAMEGRDVLACASTGSGKTVAFLLPTLHRLMAKPKRGTRALVITPTRELAAQIHQNLVSLATHTPISGAAVYGGVSMGPQEHAFRTGVDIIVATPGRLLDHLRYPYASLAGLEIVILDEADRMLDMGFLPDIKRIFKMLPPQHQTLFFSATMPPEIRQLTTGLLRNPVSIQLDRQSTPAVGITQAIYPVASHLKSKLLVELLSGPELESVICFTRTKHRANRLCEFLQRADIAAIAIHGNRSQAQRSAALAGFKKGQFRVLVATDIAARGIDIHEVSHVINFDCPHIADDYIHRVGRTGRAEATGDAFTFVAPEEESDLRTIERALGKRVPRVTLPSFDYNQKTTEKLEIPLAERLASMRQKKSDDRSRSHAKRPMGPRSTAAGAPGAPAPHPRSTGSSGGHSGSRTTGRAGGRPPARPKGGPAAGPRSDYGRQARGEH